MDADILTATLPALNTCLARHLPHIAPTTTIKPRQMHRPPAQFSPFATGGATGDGTPTIFFLINILKSFTYIHIQLSSPLQEGQNYDPSTLLSPTNRILLLTHILEQYHSFLVPQYPTLVTCLSLLGYTRVDMTDIQRSRYIAIISRILLSYKPSEFVIILTSLVRMLFTYNTDFVSTTSSVEAGEVVEPLG